MALSAVTGTLIFILANFSLYVLYLSIFRLFLSPLARFPGPKLAALTHWYEVYFDLVQEGRFPWKIKELHASYGKRQLECYVFTHFQLAVGPILRVSPDEVHIWDSDYAETHFSRNLGKRHKYAPHREAFGTPEATFNTIDHDLHKIRRGALSAMFSKPSIMSLEPMIQERVSRLCARLEEYRDSGNPVDLRLVYTCLAMDIVTDFAVGKSHDLLSTHDFSPSRHEFFAEILRKVHLFKHFPVIWRCMKVFPELALKQADPNFQLLFEFQRESELKIREVLNCDKEGAHSGTHPTVFHALLRSRLSDQDKSYARLIDEARSILGGGTESTTNALNTITVHLLLSPTKLARLRTELTTAMPRPTTPLAWKELESLPYLTAVVKEGIRLSLGVVSRLIRVAPDRDLRYKQWTIPANTAVSMSVLQLNCDPERFPAPDQFMPERWLNATMDAVDVFSFSKGSRMCLGIK